jgi:hypothetical protein
MENRAENRQMVIEKLKAIKAEERLIRITNELSNRKTKLDALAIQRLRLEADICKTVMAKYAPDVRQVDVNAEITQNVTVTSKHEVDGMLLEAGLDPETVWPTLN